MLNFRALTRKCGIRAAFGSFNARSRRRCQIGPGFRLGDRPAADRSIHGRLLSRPQWLWRSRDYARRVGGCYAPAMFQAVLKDVVESSDGGVASLVMDIDGITLDSYSRPDSRFDIQMIGIELSVVIKGVMQAASMLDAGNTHEVSIMADELITVVRMVNDNYFVALSLQPGSNIGKARYMLRTRVPEMVEELS